MAKKTGVVARTFADLDSAIALVLDVSNGLTVDSEAGTLQWPTKLLPKRPAFNIALTKVNAAGLADRFRLCAACDRFFYANDRRRKFCSEACRHKGDPGKKDRAKMYMRSYRQIPQVKMREPGRKSRPPQS